MMRFLHLLNTTQRRERALEELKEKDLKDLTGEQDNLEKWLENQVNKVWYTVAVGVFTVDQGF